MSLAPRATASASSASSCLWPAAPPNHGVAVTATAGQPESAGAATGRAAPGTATVSSGPAVAGAAATVAARGAGGDFGAAASGADGSTGPDCTGDGCARAARAAHAPDAAGWH